MKRLLAMICVSAFLVVMDYCTTTCYCYHYDDYGNCTNSSCSTTCF